MVTAPELSDSFGKTYYAVKSGDTYSHKNEKLNAINIGVYQVSASWNSNEEKQKWLDASTPNNTITLTITATAAAENSAFAKLLVAGAETAADTVTNTNDNIAASHVITITITAEGNFTFAVTSGGAYMDESVAKGKFVVRPAKENDYEEKAANYNSLFTLATTFSRV